MRLSEMHTHCTQCNFSYARVDTEAWGNTSSRRAMCPICGWTSYEEYRWEGDDNPILTKRSESQGFGVYRLIPPGGYTGYNAFHTEPSPETLDQIRDLLTNRGWKGYLSVWDHREKKARLLAGHPLDRFDPNSNK